MSLTCMADLVQGSDEWLDQRRGIVTASVVGRLVGTRTLTAMDYQCPECDAFARTACIGKRGAPVKSVHPERADTARREKAVELSVSTGDDARSLALLLTAERITGYTDPTYISDDMLRGTEDEPRAVEKYAEHYAPVTTVGFMVRDDWGFRIGYSPDGLVGDDGLIEVKSRRAKKQLETVLADQVPTENMAQLQAGLLVSGREWIDYVSYCGGLPLWVKRVTPDPRWFDAITTAVEQFESNAAQWVAAFTEATADLPTTERVVELEMVF